MQGTKTELNIYVALLLVCNLLGAVMGSGLVQTLCRYTIIIWSFAYYIKTVANFQKEPAVVKALSIFYLSLAIYGTIVLVEGKTLHTTTTTIVPMNYIYKTSWSLLPIFAFYNFAKEGKLTKQFMQKWVYVFVVVATISYYFGMLQSLARHEGEEEATNNGGYIIVSLLPMFIFLKDRSKQQYLLIAGALLLAFLSMKRGAIMVGGIAVAVYFWYLFRNSKKSRKLQILVVLMVAASGVFYVFDRLSTTSEYFQERMEETMEGDTSGRDYIQGFLIDYYMTQYTPTEQLVGRGGNATLDVLGQFAHNDWIELGINQGLLGMLLYLFFWISFVKLLMKRNVPPEVRTALAMIFVIHFLKTFFSMSYSGYTLYASMVLGYGIAVACDAGKAKKKYLLGLK
jgi:O-antigen ligase